MSNLFSFLMTIVSLAGTKLPSILPHLLIIHSEVKAIMTILGVSVDTPDNPMFMETPETIEVKQACEQAGISEEECNEVLGVFSTTPE